MADRESRNSSGITRSNTDSSVIGLDLYNQSLTGLVAKTLSNKATDADHIPCVLVYTPQMENVGSKISPTIVGDHQNRVTDFTILVLQKTISEISDQQIKAIASGQVPDQTAVEAKRL